MTDEELKAIEDRVAKSSPGRWSWNVSLKSKHMSLETTGNGHGLEIVMDFMRWGMGGARARFQNREQGLMIDGELFCKPVKGREHHEAWYQTIDHPDAVLIANAKQDLEALLAEVKRLREENHKETVAKLQAKALELSTRADMAQTKGDKEGWAKCMTEWRELMTQVLAVGA